MISKGEKICKNCRSYRPHYIKDISLDLVEVEGHCVNKKENGRFRKTNAVCECFDEILPKTKKQENKEKAARILKSIDRKVENLLIYFDE